MTQTFCILFLFYSLITGCGGGSGDGGGITGIQYTGKSSEAPITASNAVGISSTMFSGSSTAAGFGGFNKNEINDSESISPAPVLFLSEVFRKIIVHRDLSTVHQKTGFRFKTQTVSTSGECGGEFFLTINIDEGNGTFEGAFEFRGFCEDNTTLSGSGNISGQIVNEDEGTFLFSFELMHVTSGSESHSFSGDISVNLSGSSSTVMMNFLLKDDQTEKVFWVKDFSLTSVEGSNSVEISFTGRFYHPDEGYVDVQTEATFEVVGSDIYPSSGSAVAHGANNTRARLVAVSSVKCRVTADTTGNGIHDFNSGELNWSDF